MQKYRWIILANQPNIRYHNELRIDSHFYALTNTYGYEDALFQIDSNLREFRNFKKMYILFSFRNVGNPFLARSALKKLIYTYRNSRFEMFRDFISLLEKFEAPIINSFIMMKKICNKKIYDSRLSNSPIESINIKVKELKRMGRVFSKL